MMKTQIIDNPNAFSFKMSFFIQNAFSSIEKENRENTVENQKFNALTSIPINPAKKIVFQMRQSLIQTISTLELVLP